MDSQNNVFSRRRKVLIVEDNEMNREILSMLLGEEYDVLEAEDGEQGIEMLSEHYRELSLIFLDVYMPKCNGFEFLERTQKDVLLGSVPVIVTTGSDKPEDEAKCLDLGASDFVTKPYNKKVVLGRARSIIKLKESVATLSAVEYDPLTGFYTMPAFYHHAQQMLHSMQHESYDLASADIQEFKLVNSVYGEKMGDEVLRYLSRFIAEFVEDGLFARSGDKFFCLFPSEKCQDLDKWAETALQASKEAPVPNITVNYGIYRGVDVTQPISILCDRVLMAIAEIKHDQTNYFATYNDSMRDKRVRNQRMEADFEDAIAGEEFVVWYQPKVDVDTEEVVAAEALVRWFDKSGRMISPGEFIPLFEQDGLIHRLDEYVFWKVCQFQKERLAAGKKVVPISVNLSRSSVYHSGTIERYTNMVKDAGIPIDLVPIELTESAATEGKQIIGLAEALVDAGFALHMDDFGSGYSSLSGLGTLPFDVLKLDKGLIDQIGMNRGNVVLKYTIVIAQELGMKVVAEGVEEQAQVDFLKQAGCNMIQGYFYSSPKKQELFEEYLDFGLKK